MRHRIVACSGLCLILLAAGCDDTRLVGQKTQVDTFTQSGDQAVDIFTQAGQAYVDAFEQTGFHQVDSFVQKASAKIDILWVVDNSGSMAEEQQNLANNFSSFMSYIGQSLIDYHIGVVSTDMMENPDGTCYNTGHCGQLRGSTKIIDRDTLPSPEAVFASNVQVGITGGGNEMGLLAAHQALIEPLRSGANAGFLRDDASLAVIFVSDENDHSYGDINYYTRFFSAFKGVGNERKVIMAAIVGDVPDGCTGSGGEARPGEIYHQIIEELGGTTASICSDNFSLTLQQLGLTVAGLSRKFLLSRQPDPGTITVRVDEDGAGPGAFQDIVECAPDCTNPVTRNWRVDLVEGAIYFVDYVPPPQAIVEVEYSNAETVFPLSGRGDQSTLKVTVDEDGDGPNAPVEKTENVDWWYDSDANAIVFIGGYVPPMGAYIEVSYSELQRAFALSRVVENPETLTVEVDLKDGAGWRRIFQDPGTGWMFHQGSNSILFQGNYVPPYGADIRVTYSNLVWLFPLSKVPVQSTLQVWLDEDGAGAGEPVAIPHNNEGVQPGFIYYGPEQAAPYTNSISFEKIDWPPLGSIITVRYTPAG